MLRTWAELKHVTPIPTGVPLSKGVQMLHDHEFFLHCDPHMVNFEKLLQPKEPSAPPPEDRDVHPTSPPAVYSVTDRVHTLPAGLWDSDVVSTYEFFNLENGIFVRLQSPLSVVMETVWCVRESEDGTLELVEDVIIKCSRLLIGVVKGTCESGWNEIHKKMVEKIKEL
jgi:hypothetical protein